MLTNPRRIHVGDNTKIRPGGRFEAVQNSDGSLGEIRFGRSIRVEDRMQISVAGLLVIGDGGLIASDVFITDHDHVPPEDPTLPLMVGTVRARTTTIGRRVWLGPRAIILKGVTVGDNAVIGANSVVTHDVPPGGRVAGIPARPIEGR
jgi:acetyltransferase-like isoleucine patch superfamily enzyme